MASTAWPEDDTVIERRLRVKRRYCAHCKRKVPIDDQWRFVSHDKSPTRMVCVGSGLPALDPPTEEEIAEVYRSLGVEPPKGSNPNIGPRTPHRDFSTSDPDEEGA
jgi:hypothetical protein